MAEKVVLGLSDGVDSAVAALRLKKAGYEVHALYLDIGGEKARCDAEKSAALLRIPVTVRDIREELEKCVIRPFRAAYLAGETPSPCPLCNPAVKLPALIALADAIGAEKIATGHYAVTDGRAIYKGPYDYDQSYMLCLLTKEQIARLLLPLGRSLKPDIRREARETGLAVSDKPDSRENCFIKGESYADWIARTGPVPGEGPVYFAGCEVARHSGIYRYTVGQRWSEMMGDRRAYVKRIDARKNSIHLCLWEELFTDEVVLRDVVFPGERPDSPFRAAVRARHTRWEEPGCTVEVTGTRARLVTDTLLRAPAPGQVAALYDGDRVIGGGIIAAE